MKKISIFAIATIALCLGFTSCAPDSGMELLEKSDITKDWVEESTWSGTIDSTVKGDKDLIKEDTSKKDDKKADNKIENQKYTVMEFKAYCMDKPLEFKLGTTKITTDSCIKANKKRNKVYIESVYTTEIGDKSVTTTTKISLTKDKK